MNAECDCNCACPIEGEAPLLPLPAAYYLEITPECNNLCAGCGNIYAAERGSLQAPMDGHEWRTLINRLAGHAVHFKVTGGEPTLHPDFKAIIDEMGRSGVPFTLFSNGRWARDTHQLLIDSGCQGALISLHGPDARTHEAFCGVRGTFEETCKNIREAARDGLSITASMVLTRQNTGRIAETLDLALECGCNHLVCNRFIGSSPFALSPEDLRTAVQTVEALRAHGHPVQFGNCIPNCFEPSSSTGCTAGSTFATIDPWGRMRPCNHAPVIAGDLRAGESIAATWHGPVMQMWRNLVSETCSSCAAFEICRGGCRAQAMLLEKVQDPLISAPLQGIPEMPALLLYAGLYPQVRGQQRLCDKTTLLVYGAKISVVPLSLSDMPLDGTLTLNEIADLHGQAALDWIGKLYQAGMIDWI